MARLDKHALLRRSAGVMTIVVASVLGTVATAVAWRNEQRGVTERDRRLTDSASGTFAAQLISTIESLRGVSGLAADGSVSDIEFKAFSSEVLPGSLIGTLSLAVVVPGNQLASVEKRLGRPIQDTDGQGGFVPAANRNEHIVVTNVFPESAASLTLIGFDVASDTVRRATAEAARKSGRPAISQPIRLASSGEPGVFITAPVRLLDGSVIGFVSSGVSVDSLMARLRKSARGVSLTVALDQGVISGVPRRFAPSRFRVGGRSFSVWAKSSNGANWALPLGLGVATMAFCVCALIIERRNRQLLRRLSRSMSRNEDALALSADLMQLTSSRAVLNVLKERAPEIVGAQAMLIGRRSIAPRNELTIDGLGPDGKDVASLQALATAFDRRAHAVFVDEAGTNTQWVPLFVGVAEPSVAAGFVWADHDRLPENGTLSTMLGELGGRAYERSLVAELVEQATLRLGTLTSTLASAVTSKDVIETIERLAGPVMGNTVARLVECTVETKSAQARFFERSDFDRMYPGVTEGWRPFVCAYAAPVLGANGKRFVLVLGWDVPVSPIPSAQSIVTAIGEVAQQALTRSSLYEQEHELIVELQLELLPRVDVPDGFDLAVRYIPANTVVGLGGDWYDVITAGNVVHITIGDVTGHGPAAVATMAQIKSVLADRIRTNSALPDGLQAASALLEPKTIQATAQIVRIDTSSGVVEYVNAGHPYPMIRRAATGDVVWLDGPPRALLGVEALPGGVHTAWLEPGDWLVMYTDGLVERRYDTIIDHLERLASKLGALGPDLEIEACADAIVDSVMSQDQALGGDSHSEAYNDDAALIVLRRRK